MFRTHCATCLHYITTLKIALFRYCKKIPTSVVDVPDLDGAQSNIQPETIIVANIRSKKHPVARKEYKVIERAGLTWMKGLYCQKFPQKFIPQKLQILAISGDPRNFNVSKIPCLTVNQ